MGQASASKDEESDEPGRTVAVPFWPTQSWVATLLCQRMRVAVGLWRHAGPLLSETKGVNLGVPVRTFPIWWKILWDIVAAQLPSDSPLTI